MTMMRGMGRLWAAGTFVWLVVVGGLNAMVLREDAAVVWSRLEADLRDGGAPVLDTPWGRFTPRGELAEFLEGIQRLGEAEAHRRMAARYGLAVERLTETVALLVLPPLAFGLLLAGTGWVIRGFKG